jgi:hypothetical protein
MTVTDGVTVGVGAGVGAGVGVGVTESLLPPPPPQPLMPIAIMAKTRNLFKVTPLSDSTTQNTTRHQN